MIPAFNEAGSVGKVVRDVIRLTGHPVVVIDDKSIDNTADEARAAGADVIQLHIRHGAWGAVQTGMRYALQSGYDIVVTMDADEQHDPASISELLAPLQSGNADAAIGLYLERGSRLRIFAWGLLRQLSGLKIEDITSGFRAYKRPTLEILTSRAATLLTYQDIGVLILMKNAGQRIIEVNVPMYDRKSGISRIYYSWHAVLTYMSQTCLLCISKVSLSWPSRKKPVANGVE